MERSEDSFSVQIDMEPDLRFPLIRELVEKGWWDSYSEDEKDYYHRCAQSKGSVNWLNIFHLFPFTFEPGWRS